MNTFSPINAGSSNNLSAFPPQTPAPTLEIVFRKRILERWTKLRVSLLTKLHFTTLSSNGVTARLAEVSRESSWAVHILCCVVPVTISFSVLEKERDLTIFDFHALLMTVGTQVLFAEGIILKQDGIITRTLSEIMNGTKRHKERMLHATFSILGILSVFGGLAFIIINKVLHSKTIIPSSIHSVIGTFVIALVITQLFIGVKKLSNLEGGATEQRSFRYHGELALMIFDLGTLAVLTGLVSFLNFFSISLFFSTTFVLTLWFFLQSFMNRSSLVDNTAGEERDGLVNGDANDSKGDEGVVMTATASHVGQRSSV